MMKWEDFEKRTAKWSSNDVVKFLMEGTDWHDAIMEYIESKWTSLPSDFDSEDIDVYQLLNKA